MKEKFDMGSAKEALTTVTEWLRHATEFGLSLIMVFIIVDVLFPGTTGLISNLGIIVGEFSKEGLSGLIALLLFLLLFRSKYSK